MFKMLYNIQVQDMLMFLFNWIVADMRVQTLTNSHKVSIMCPALAKHWTSRQRHLTDFRSNQKCRLLWSVLIKLEKYCRTTTKWPKWHSSLESIPTIPFTYKACVWMTRQLSLHRSRQIMIKVLSVLYHDWLTFYAGHLYWTFNLLCNRPLCKWYSLKQTQGSQCHLGPFVLNIFNLLRTCYWKKLLVNHSSSLHTTSIKNLQN